VAESVDSLKIEIDIASEDIYMAVDLD